MKFLRKILPGKREQGDTMIEVLIAMTIMGVAVTASMAAMNNNLLSIMNTAERTAVRTEINSQVDMLNYVHDNQPGTWRKIARLAFGAGVKDKSGYNQAQYLSTCSMHQYDNYGGPSEATSSAPNASFWLEMTNDPANPVTYRTSGSSIDFASLSHGVTSPKAGKGVWIDAVTQTDKKGNNYIDFYVKACWLPYGTNTNDSGKVANPSTTKTIVRIYDVEG